MLLNQGVHLFEDWHALLAGTDEEASTIGKEVLDGSRPKTKSES